MNHRGLAFETCLLMEKVGAIWSEMFTLSHPCVT